MKKTLFFTCLILLTLNFKANADTLRSMYVDGFSSILGNESAENTLLSYAQSNGIEKLLLYELHIVNANHNLSSTSTNFILADFISKAKTNYGILFVGAVAENAWFFTNVIDTYNNSRTNANEKFDVYNLEFEFWIDTHTNSGGYYCNTYLTPNNLPCTNAGAFDYFISILQDMRTLANNNSHPITTEAYVGWPTAAQAATIGANLDKLLLHAYVANPSTSFTYADDRIIDFANGTPGLDVSIIFSSETNFMGNWLISNSMSEAEDTFTTDWTSGSSGWTNNINLEGFTYFTYSYQANITLFSSSSSSSVAAVQSLSTGTQDTLEKVAVYPNPVEKTLYIENLDDVKNIMIYNSIGQLIEETTEKEIDFTTKAKGIYFLKIYTENGIKTKKIIKD
ncbi:T9SS type A sorting domain-containing protein [Flavivirga jejuensis]|uniref:T9SS type A sorting domain-containing protein n=1 Tax=Flavivirga jejuensis TaxID=870487 RepID=A0ABT8WVF9_9FLAO|nr:T9SS type A sorting domain-containing protein [Flavivirga jejuensis]MDO5976989.1 T9SS type A sorting domain-containing protein [Flavivirga jejuensis]